MKTDIPPAQTLSHRQDPPCPPNGDHLAAVVRSSALAVVSTDPDGTVRSWNSAAEALFGYTADEMIGRSVLAVVPPDQCAETAALVERIRAGEHTAPFVAVRLRKDGSPVPVSVTPWPVRSTSGELLGLAAAYADRSSQGRAESEARRLRSDLEQQVTDRTRELSAASEGQRASEERFRLFVEGVRDYAIVMLDPQGRVASWNAGAERITGCTADEAVGQPFARFYPPAAGERGVWSAERPEVAWTAARFEEEGWRVRRDGSRFWANSVVTQIRDEGGQVLGFSTVTRDLTERKRVEEEVRRRAAELEAANRDLAQKNAENEMFVYSVSHDLRSPLVNLQGFSKELDKACRGLAELLAGDAVPGDVRDRGRALLDGRVAKSIGFIQAAVTRLSNIIDALLRLSRAGRVDYRWEVVDVGEVASEVVRAAHGTITERGAVVALGKLPPVWGDRTAVEQLIGNLVGNALTYLDPARPGVIEVGALGAGADGFRTYFVRDNGLGIAEGHRQKIFQAFQRAHPGVGSGEGLGLAIVARVAERHRGRVWVESQPGRGSTFYVSLPAPAGGR